MQRTACLATFGVVLTVAASGCQSHEAKATDLQKEYDHINQQFARDCSAEMSKLPQELSPKCADESKKLKEASDRLQAQHAKK